MARFCGRRERKHGGSSLFPSCRLISLVFLFLFGGGSWDQPTKLFFLGDLRNQLSLVASTMRGAARHRKGPVRGRTFFTSTEIGDPLRAKVPLLQVKHAFLPRKENNK